MLFSIVFFSFFKSNEIEQLRIKSELEKFKPSSLIKLNKSSNGFSAAVSSNELIKQEQVSSLKKDFEAKSSPFKSFSTTKVKRQNYPNENDMSKLKNCLTTLSASSSTSSCSPSSDSSASSCVLTPKKPQLIDSSTNRNNLLKRTLSNSLLDLTGSKMCLNSLNQMGHSLHRAGSECSIVNIPVIIYFFSFLLCNLIKKVNIIQAYENNILKIMK